MPKPYKVNSLATKILVLFGLLVLSTIPRMYVDGIITDRQLYEREATESVTTGWAASHEIGEIEMDVPYHRIGINQTTKHKQRIDFTETSKPERLVVDYKDQIEFRSRGIFRIPIYKADVTIKGDVLLPKDLDPQLSDELVSSNVQKLRFQLPNVDAVSDFQLTIGGEPATATRVDGGLEFELTQQTFQPGESLKFELRLRMNGYQSFKIGTSSASLEVNMASTWPHPSFNGQLPIDQKVSDKGFTARWKIIQDGANQRARGPSHPRPASEGAPGWGCRRHFSWENPQSEDAQPLFAQFRSAIVRRACARPRPRAAKQAVDSCRSMSPRRPRENTGASPNRSSR